jgi:two-component system, response regulator PdtaR
MPQPATQRAVILIVEDEFLIRMATAEAIRDAGFEVVEAADADAAIAILESRSDTAPI